MAERIRDLFPRGDLRCLEICSGTKFLARWLEVAQTLGKDRNIEVSVTDYVARSVQSPKPLQNLQLSSGALSIQDPPPLIPCDQRFNIVVGTYAFDSTFQEGDVLLIPLADSTRADGQQWFEILFRVALLDTHSRGEIVRQAFATGDFSKLQPKDLADLSIEHIARPVELEYVCGDDSGFVRRRFAELPPEKRDFSKAFSVPGGLVSWIDAAFANCIAPGGAFIVGDVGCFDTNDPGDVPYHRIGAESAALFHTVDFLLAQWMLQSRGYAVEVLRVPEMARRYAAHREEVEDVAVGGFGRREKKSNQFWMVVQRGTTVPVPVHNVQEQP